MSELKAPVQNEMDKQLERIAIRYIILHLVHLILESLFFVFMI